MKAYRYNAERREDRRFNLTGKEKNPNCIRFYGKSLQFAENYKSVYDDKGYQMYNCELETVEIENVKLFDMESNFKSLNVYKQYISELISRELNDYRKFGSEAKTTKEKKMWGNMIEHTVNSRESELIKNLKANEFQALSDFDRQNDLLAELKGLGFDGYETKNEIAVFNY